MHHDDLISQVRVRARLHGRNEARHVISAVLTAFRRLVPDAPFQRIAAQLPAGLIVAPSEAVPDRDDSQRTFASRSLVREVANSLHVDEANAAFLARIVFENLNACCRVVTPATIAPSLPADVRPLLTARADDPAYRYRRVLSALSAGPALSPRTPQAAPAAASQEPAAAELIAAAPHRERGELKTPRRG